MKIMGEKLCRQPCLEDLETIGLAEGWADEDLARLASFEQGAQRSEAETISKREKKLSVGTSSV